MKIEGKNACLEAVKAGTKIDKVLISEDIDKEYKNNFFSVIKNQNIKINFVPKQALDRESITKKHQGIICFTPSYKYYDLKDVIKENGFYVILDGVEDPHNLGSIIRSSECAGVDAVIIGSHRCATVNETVIKVSAGAISHIKVVRMVNINDAIKYLQTQGIKVFALDMDGQDIYETDLTCGVALVVGSEGKGVKFLTKNLCDASVKLPLLGKVNSLNASIASAISVYEVVRQRNNK